MFSQTSFQLALWPCSSSKQDQILPAAPAAGPVDRSSTLYSQAHDIIGLRGSRFYGQPSLTDTIRAFGLVELELCCVFW